MSRKFIATVLAASLAVTSISAVPAQAGEDDLVKLLAGATTLFIIGKALSDKPARASTSNDREYYYDRRHDYDHRHDGRHDRDRWHRDSRKRVLPGYCRSSIWTQQGRLRFLDRRCLRQNYAHARDLPKQCRITTGNKSGHGRRGYSIRCLKRHGYEIGRK